ncbi:MAG TPA: hypothetical protein VML55_26655 [Planctomycetaceae bacterium]|nr:hypothetical protein [Planctomycetaceae bacterium]
MTDLLPHPFLFRFSIPVRRIAALPRPKPKLLELPDDCRLPDFGVFDAAPPFADVRVAWNEDGFGVSVRVDGKRHPPDCDPERPDESDSLSVWIDTRNTQSIHRASRFCHGFRFFPAGGGRTGNEPAARQMLISQAREDAPQVPADRLHVASQPDSTGYRLEAWLPAEALHGFDPETSPRLGFYYHVRDRELGEQFLTVGPEFPFRHDPSLWSTLELS